MVLGAGNAKCGEAYRGAKAPVDSAALIPGLKSGPTNLTLLSAFFNEAWSSHPFRGEERKGWDTERFGRVGDVGGRFALFQIRRDETAPDLGHPLLGV